MIETSALSLIAFVGPETLPVHVATEFGCYAGDGLDVRLEVATGSIDQMVQLIDGQCDLVMTAIDNIIAYNVGQGGVPVEPLLDLVAFLGCASEPRPLIALPEVSGLTDLRGRRIAVDALNTGFSFLLRQVLEDAGLGKADYELVPVGAPPARWKSMEDGDCAAELLSKAFAARAISLGCHELRADPDPWKSYQGGVFVARQGWIADNPDLATGFIRATLAATDWILDPGNRAQIPDMLRAHLPHMTNQAAAHAAENMAGLLPQDLRINEQGLRSVISLRQKYGSPPANLDDPETHLDLSLYHQVMNSR